MAVWFLVFFVYKSSMKRPLYFLYRCDKMLLCLSSVAINCYSRNLGTVWRVL
jgi:hypothetical protein